MKILRFLLVLSCCFVPFFAVMARASPIGEWRIADGSANVTIHSCGINLCGRVSWSQESQALVGKTVLLSMKAGGANWSGTIINAKDGQRYNARISLQDNQTLKVEGCVFGGLVCGGQHWTRIK